MPQGSGHHAVGKWWIAAKCAGNPWHDGSWTGAGKARGGGSNPVCVTFYIQIEAEY